MVGDLHTIALVGTNGTIDWYCCPAFDSPSVFGRILDREKGGFFRLRPEGDEWTSRQLYFPDTNVLITRFYTDRGVGEIQDFMPIESASVADHRHRLIRRVVVVRGTMRFHVEVMPAFNYARDEHEVELHPHGVLFRSETLTLALEGAIALAMGTDRVLERRPGGGVAATLELKAGETRSFVLERVAPDHICRPYPERETAAAFDATVAYWRKWLAQSRLPRPLARDGQPLRADAEAADVRADRRDRRGADDVAARADRRRAQLGLPLHVDPRRGVLALRPAAARLHRRGRRRSWPGSRTACATARSVRAARCRSCTRIDGAPSCPRRTLRTWTGYRGSQPVRIGNGAAGPAPARHLRRADRLRLPLQQVRLADLPRHLGRTSAGSSTGCASNWDQADEGIWETRGGQKDFTYSRLMCWVAIDRAIRIAPRPRPARRHRALDRVARRDLHADHGARLERGARRVRAALRLRGARRVAAADAAGAASSRRATRAGCRRSTRSTDELVCDSLVLPLQHRGLARRPARRGGHVLDLLLLVRRGAHARRAGSTRRGSRSRRCSPTPTTWACTRRRSARRASCSATSRRPSRTWR